MNSPTISVIIPAYNSAKTIGTAIQAMFNQTHKDFELIIVDDGSTDNTKEVVRQNERVKYIYQHNQGPAAARNRGVSESSGTILFFTDADCIPEPDWIEKILKHFDNKDISVVAGSYGIANDESILARCIHHEILFRHHKLMPDYPKSFGSYNFAIRRSVFEQVKGFNPDYPHASGEDNDLSYKILEAGGKIYFERSALVNHHHPTRLRKYLKEQFRHGFWRVKMYMEHPQMAKGDNYTFYKDVVELPLCASALVFFALSFFMPFLWIWFCFSFFVLFVLEVIYGFRVSTNISEGIFMIYVTSLRSFARLFGFSSGIFTFFSKKRLKKT